MLPINILSKFESFQEQWTPKIIGELNGQHVKLAKLSGEFVWHDHKDEDELFLVMRGTLLMHFRDRSEQVNEGEILIVPKGVEHLPEAKTEEVWVLLFEPIATRHTGEVVDPRTVENQDLI